MSGLPEYSVDVSSAQFWPWNIIDAFVPLFVVFLAYSFLLRLLGTNALFDGLWATNPPPSLPPGLERLQTTVTSKQ